MWYKTKIRRRAFAALLLALLFGTVTLIALANGRTTAEAAAAAAVSTIALGLFCYWFSYCWTSRDWNRSFRA